MELLIEQLERRLLELDRWRIAAATEAAALRGLPASGGPEAREPADDDGDWPLLGPKTAQQPSGSAWWLRWRLNRPASWPAGQTALAAGRLYTRPILPTPVPTREPLVPPFPEWVEEEREVEGVLYLDGRAYHGLDRHHTLIRLPASGGPEYSFAARLWAGVAPRPLVPGPSFRLVSLDEGAVQLSHDLRVLLNALRALPPEHPARVELERLAEAALLAIDWRSPGSPAFRASLELAHRLVSERLAEFGAAAYEPTIVAVGHAHIDCAWIWPIEQTRMKTGHTFSTVLRLMERYPEYRFLASNALQYAMARERFPEVYEEIRRRVAEGRWEPVGGTWVECDCNLPDGESLARQLLLGTRFFEREFGLETKVAWLPDSFGFSWALPTLLAAAGIRYFVTHKLSWSRTNRFPYDIFRWRGPDGSEVLAHMLCMPEAGEAPIRSTYNADILPGTVRAAWRRFANKELYDELLAPFGYGDGGGGPTEEMLEAARRLGSATAEGGGDGTTGGKLGRGLPGFPRVRMGTAREFFEKLEARLAGRADVPVWDGELYLEYHRGTYTSQAAEKRRNAEAQRLYHAAELYAATAHALLGAPYPREELAEGWRLILTNQFHDILPGSSIGEVYLDSAVDYQRAAELGERVLGEALGQLAGAMDLPEASLVVFNPGPYASAGYIELPACPLDGGSSTELVPCDAAGEALPSQRTAEGGLLVYCEGVPANGYRAFGLRRAASGAPEASPIQMSARRIETPFWEIELDGAGLITRLRDRAVEREAVPPGRAANRLVAFEDKPLDWDAWDIDPFFAAKASDVEGEVDELQAAQVVEAGPERGVLLLRQRTGQSTISQRLTVYARVPRIDFVTEVDWRERQTLLKTCFPTTIRSRRATYEIQFGSIERPTHRNTSWEREAFEVPAQRWVDLSDAYYGVALLADCKHGYGVEGDSLWLSLLRGPISPDPAADLGQHRFTYSLLPHPAGLEAVRRAASALTRPLLWRREPAHAGRLPACFSLVESDHPGVVVETLKRAEDDDALIVRLYEADGGATRARLRFGGALEVVEEVNLLERQARPLAGAAGNEVPVELRAHEVKTLRVRMRGIIGPQGSSGS